MDPVAAFLISFITWVGIGNQMEQLEMTTIQQEAALALLNAEVVELQKFQEEAKDAYSDLADQYNGLYEEYLRLASTHASGSARDLVYNDKQKEAIEQILKEIQYLDGKTQYLDDKIQLLHP